MEETKQPQAKETSKHLQNIRRRFTETAGTFGEFVMTARVDEAKRAAEVIAQDFKDVQNARALDLCCGPGTFVRAMAERVKSAAGLDITAAMLTRARKETIAAGLENVAFISGDVNGLPFADESWDIVFCGYAIHHLLRPEHVIAEMARVVRRGGRVGIKDMFVPEGANSDALNRIERVRDPSHATTQSIADLRRLFHAVGLRELFIEPQERNREFNHWMHVAGHEPGSEAYAEVRRLMEASLERDVTGYRPRIDAATGELHFTQHAVLLVAEK